MVTVSVVVGNGEYLEPSGFRHLQKIRERHPKFDEEDEDGRPTSDFGAYLREVAVLESVIVPPRDGAG